MLHRTGQIGGKAWATTTESPATRVFIQIDPMGGRQVRIKKSNEVLSAA